MTCGIYSWTPNTQLMQFLCVSVRNSHVKTNKQTETQTTTGKKTQTNKKNPSKQKQQKKTCIQTI